MHASHTTLHNILRSPYEAPRLPSTPLHATHIDATKYAYWIAADHLLTMSTVQSLHGLHVLRSPYEAPLHTTRMLTLYAATFVFLQHTSTSFILHHILQNTHGSNFPNLLLTPPLHALHVLRSPYEAPLDATKYAYWVAPHHRLTMSTVQPLHGLPVIRSPYEAPLDKTIMLTLYAATFIF